MTARAVVPRLAVVLAVSSALIGAPSPARACESMTFSIQLTDYVVNDVTPFYYAEEGDDAGPEFVVSAVGQVCPPDESGQVDYDTPPFGTNPAEASPVELLGDYQRTNGFSTFAANGARRDEVQVPLHDDTTAEDTVAETFQVQLSNVRGFNANPGSPMTAPFFIVDEEGAHRARFVGATASAFENRGTFDPEPIKIPVLRAGPTTGDVTFSVSPSNGEVFPTEGTVEFREDGRLGFVKVRVEDDTQDEPDEVFTISLGGAATENTFQLTVDDNDLPGGGDEDTIAPRVWFHHPKHGRSYRRGSLGGADTIHAFVSERPTHNASRIVSADIALRKKMRNGSCSWWRGTRWRRGGCSEIRWLNPTERIDAYSPEKVLFTYTRYDSLRPSVGTRIKNYTAYARALDVAGNRSPLEPGANIATFEVTRR